MPIRFKCTCGKVLKVPDASAGKTAKCPGCGAKIAIPAGAAPPAPSPEPTRVAQPAHGRRCPGCGKVYDESTLICTDCGINLSTGEQLASAPATGKEISPAATPSKKPFPWKPVTGAVAALAVLVVGYLLLAGREKSLAPAVGKISEETPAAVETAAKIDSDERYWQQRKEVEQDITKLEEKLTSLNTELLSFYSSDKFAGDYQKLQDATFECMLRKGELSKEAIEKITQKINSMVHRIDGKRTIARDHAKWANEQIQRLKQVVETKMKPPKGDVKEHREKLKRLMESKMKPRKGEEVMSSYSPPSGWSLKETASAAIASYIKDGLLISNYVPDDKQMQEKGAFIVVTEHKRVDDIEAYINETVERGKKWRKIRKREEIKPEIDIKGANIRAFLTTPVVGPQSSTLVYYVHFPGSKELWEFYLRCPGSHFAQYREPFLKSIEEHVFALE